jgi:hypothetical protein
MKKMQIFFAALAIHASNMYGVITAENPLFLLALAVKQSEQIETIALEKNDEEMAKTLLAVMQDCINFSQKTKAQMSSNSSFLALKRSNVADLEKTKQEREEREKEMIASIKRYESSAGRITANEVKKVNRRRNDRDDAKRDAKAAADKILENQAQIDTTAGKNAVLQEQLVQNEKMFEEALDAYITNLGMVVLVDSVMQITYKRYPGQPITPKQYAQLVKVLEDARVEFEKQEKAGWSKNVMIDLEVGQETELFSLSEVIDCIGRNKPTAGTNYSMMALKIAGGITIAAIVSYAAYNKYQDKDAFDRRNLDAMGQSIYDAGASVGTSIQTGVNNAGKAIYDTSVGKYIVDTGANTGNAMLKYSNDTLKSITDSESYKQAAGLAKSASEIVSGYGKGAYDVAADYYAAIAEAAKTAGSYLPSWPSETAQAITTTQKTA